MTEQTDDDTLAGEATEVEPASKTVRVPTGKDAHGYHAYVDCEPEAAAGWDARRWVRVR